MHPADPAAASALTLHTARACAVLYGLTLALLLTHRYRHLARPLWTAACALLWLHVALAFHLVHRWSHAHALAHTADQTFAAVGLRSGVGLYLNYLTMLHWLADVLAWWFLGHRRYFNRPRPLNLLLHAFLLFMMFNAAIVFAPSPSRYVALVVTAILALLFVRRATRPPPVPRQTTLQQNHLT